MHPRSPRGPARVALGCALLLGALSASGCDRSLLHPVPERRASNVATGELPAAPEGLVATAGPESVELRWEPVDGAQSYTIYWSLSADVDPALGAERITNAGQPYLHLARAAGVRHFYAVAAVNPVGESELSSEVSALPAYPPPCGPKDAPAGLTLEYLGEQQMKLSWSDVLPAEEGFIVHRQRAGFEWGELRRLPADSEEYVDDTVGLDGRYLYRVVGYFGACEGVPSDVVEVWTEPLPPADLVAATASSSSVALSWTDANANESGYRVERHDGAAWLELAVLEQDAEGYVVTGLVPGEGVIARVTAVNPSLTSPSVEASARSSHLPELSWQGAPFFAGQCELVVPGVVVLDEEAGAEVASAEGTCSLATTSGASDSGMWARLESPSTGSRDVTWTVQDSFGSEAMIAGAVSVGLTSGVVRGLARLPSLTVGDDTGAGRQALNPGCANCQGRRGALSITTGTGCVLDEDGAVWCWGDNSLGQLGDGNSGTQLWPTRPCTSGYGVSCEGGAFLDDVRALDHDSGRFLAVVGPSGRVLRWGGTSLNYRPLLLGNPTVGDLPDDTLFSPAPVCERVEGEVCVPLEGAASVSIGYSRACALMGDGTARCWGDGYLGDGTSAPSELPVTVCASGSGDTCVPLAGIDDISLGRGRFACARVGGQALCWGTEALSLGRDDDALPAANPVAVCAPEGCDNPLTGVKEVVAGYNSACALLDSGEVVCWGLEQASTQSLGDGYQANGHGQALPSPVCASGNAKDVSDPCVPLQKVTDLDAALYGYCVLVDDDGDDVGDRVLCWGHRFAQGTPYGVGLPEEICGYQADEPCSGWGDAVAIDVGSSHVCVRTLAGDARCTGYNVHGQLGRGFTSGSLTPFEPDVSVVCETGTDASCSPLLDVTSIEAGELATCALLGSGELRCFGSQTEGELALGTPYATSPRPVCATNDAPPCAAAPPIDDVVSVSEGILLRANGQVWTLGNEPAPVCADATTSPCTPLAGAVSAAGLQSVGCAVHDDGRASCWGVNTSGQLGDGTALTRSHAAFVRCGPDEECLGGQLQGVRQISLARSHTCAVLSSGEVRCWGDNYYGQLGDGSLEARRFPVPVCTAGYVTGGACSEGALERVTSLAGRAGYHCALDDAGSVSCWGGVPGLGTVPYPTPVPLDVLGEGPALQIAAGDGYACVVLESGRAACWGNNYWGQLGRGTSDGLPTAPASPLALVCASGSGPSCPPLEGVVGLTTSTWSMCALLENGELRCWGRNHAGSLGSGPRETDALVPATVCAPGGGEGCTLSDPFTSAAVSTCEVFDVSAD